MNPRKLPRNNSHSSDENKEEKTSLNMSIEEEPKSDHPHSKKKSSSNNNSFNINQERKNFSNNIQIPLNENICNTQQRPTTTFSFYL